MLGSLVACSPRYGVRVRAYRAARRRNRGHVAPGNLSRHALPPSLILQLASLLPVFRRPATPPLPSRSFHEMKVQPLYLPRYTTVVVPLGVWQPENERAGVSLTRLLDVAVLVHLYLPEPCPRP